MSLCAFVLVSAEFMPVSLLTPLASGLGVTEGQAGRAIAASGLFAVLTSLSISSLAGNFNRKSVLVALTALMVASAAMVAFAPNFGVLLAGRAFLGVAIGGCWSMSTAVLMRISPHAFVPRAIATLQGGSALATAVAAPMGSVLGAAIGWRGAFLCVVPLAALALIWQALSLPSLPPERKANTANAFRLLSRPGVLIGMLAVAALFMGQFALFTYLRPFLETVTHVGVPALSLILLGIGVAGLIGTLLIGHMLHDHLRSVLIVIPIFMGAIALALVHAGGSLAITAALLAAWGLIATPAPVGWFTWLSRVLPDDAEAGGGLMVAIIQLAITLGATTGGMIFDAAGPQAAFLASAVILGGSALLAIAASRSRH